MAEEIAREFVERYYQYLENYQLHMVLSLYKPESKMARMEETYSIERFETLDAIELQIMSWNYSEFSYESVSCESSHQGILVVVIGTLRTPLRRKRKFAQSLFLVPEIDNNDYFILTDIFCFVGDEETTDSSVSGMLIDNNNDPDPDPDIESSDNDPRSPLDWKEFDNLLGSPTITTDAYDESEDLLAYNIRLQLALTEPSEALDIKDATLDQVQDQQQDNAEYVNGALITDDTGFDSLIALEHANGVPDTEPGKAMHDTAVEEPVASTENIFHVGFAEEPSKSTYPNILKSRPRAPQMSSTATQPSAFDIRIQQALTESVKSLDTKDESLDQVQDQPKNNAEYVKGAASTEPVKVVHQEPIEESVVVTAAVAYAEEHPKITVTKSATEAINGCTVQQSAHKM